MANRPTTKRSRTAIAMPSARNYSATGEQRQPRNPFQTENRDFSALVLATGNQNQNQKKRPSKTAKEQPKKSQLEQTIGTLGAVLRASFDIGDKKKSKFNEKEDPYGFRSKTLPLIAVFFAIFFDNTAKLTTEVILAALVQTPVATREYFSETGMLFACVPLTQILVMHPVGVLVDWYGDASAFIYGNGCIITVCVMYSYVAYNFYVYLLIGTIQGIGNSLTAAAAYSLIARLTKNDSEKRAKAEGFVTAAILTGVITGSSFGLFIFDANDNGYTKRHMYGFLAGLGFIDLTMRMLLLVPPIEKRSSTVNEYQKEAIKLLSDPYILIVLFASAVQLIYPAYYWTFGMRYSMRRNGVKQKTLGFVGLTAQITGLLVQVLPSWYMMTWGRWRFVAVGCGLQAIALCFYPTFVPINRWLTWSASVITRIGWTLAWTSIMSLLVNLTETRHKFQYGYAGSLGAASNMMGLTIGGLVESVVGHTWGTEYAFFIMFYFTSFIAAIAAVLVCFISKIQPL